VVVRAFGEPERADNPIPHQYLGHSQ